jgi:hypothetical protein
MAQEEDKLMSEKVLDAVEALLGGRLNECLIFPNGGEIKFANDERKQPENGEEEDE